MGRLAATTSALTLLASALCAAHAALIIAGMDQDASGGTVTAARVVAPSNGKLVIHCTGVDKKPGPVAAHAPLKAGENTDVAAILTEPVASGEMLTLMV